MCKDNTESTEMVRCGYCSEMVEAGSCHWHIVWICPDCIDDAWDQHCKLAACE